MADIACDLLDQLDRLGAETEVASTTLRIRLPDGAMAPALAEAIRVHKPAMIDALIERRDMASMERLDRDLAEAGAAPDPPELVVVWWRDSPAAVAPLVWSPPRACLGPIACARLGPCERHTGGLPCDVGRRRGPLPLDMRCDRHAAGKPCDVTGAAS